MANHFSILAWTIPWMEELGGLQSTGSQRDTAEHKHLVQANITKLPQTKWLNNENFYSEVQDVQNQGSN